MKMLHTCIRVKDLEASLEFYTKAFPLKEVRRKDFPDHQFTLVFLKTQGDDFEIELTYNYGSQPHYYFVTDPDGYKVEVIRL